MIYFKSNKRADVSNSLLFFWRYYVILYAIFVNIIWLVLYTYYH